MLVPGVEVMSVVSMLVAARAALAERRERRRAYEELAALDDRSLADIGLHRSQLPGLVESQYESIELDAAPVAVRTSARRVEAGLSRAQEWLRRV
jgi:uncharacterized protein YjiS (DUF1127 family)